MPYTGINWVTTDQKLVNKDGHVIWEALVEFPDYFSDTAKTVVSEKYLHNSAKKPERSLRQLIDRVSDQITEKGLDAGYFKNSEEADSFNYYLKFFQVHQYFAFNSPVYFNAGLEDKPQLSACFIGKMDDHMQSITDAGSQEAQIFKSGSGSGMDYSSLRSSLESVRDAGCASGPVSFLKGHDTFAGVIRSGGVVRRSAKMAVLRVDHGDIIDFITVKAHEENKLRILEQAGISPFFKDSELSDEVSFQNTNLSVKMDKVFLDAVKGDLEWNLIGKNGQTLETIKAADLMQTIGESAYLSGEPGVHFTDTINDWHVSPKHGKINSSNPCSEFFYLDNSACNLVSLNLVNCLYEDYKHPLEITNLFEKVVEICIIAQDIICGYASYPTEKIRQISINHRPLGLGFTNLGGLLMLSGIPYNSSEGRRVAGKITNRLTSTAYKISAKLAKLLGAYAAYDEEDHYRVIKKHLESAKLEGYNTRIWEDLIERKLPFRNAQVSLLAPTGTISFLMDAATLGIEPEYLLTRFKNMVGGGVLKIVNNVLEESLANLGYSPKICEQYLETGKLNISEKHLQVFRCANEIHYEDHLLMMAACQPFLSGSISKTVNMPNSATTQDIIDLYFRAYELGLKSVIVYRDGCKVNQVLTEVSKPNTGKRKALPDDRPGGTHKFVINNSVKGYINYSTYEDGELGEFFTRIAKEGSTFSGFLDTIATLTSIALQYGVPLEDLVNKMINRRFEPSGITQNSDIRFTHSIVDYIFKYLGIKFLSEEDKKSLGLVKDEGPEQVEMTISDASLCPECGSQLRRLGSCEQCTTCGYSGGSCS